MTRVKGNVLDELNHADRWLTTTEVMKRLEGVIPHCTRSSVGRALRRLQSAGLAVRKWIPGDQCGNRQWATTANSADANFPEAKPTFRVKLAPVKRVKKTTKQPRLRLVKTIQVVNAVVQNNTNQGDLIMQIEQGVEAIVAEWVAADKKFSAHDVTKELRDRVNAGTLQVDPGVAGTVQVGGQTVTRVEHKFVRDAVHTLMVTGSFNYDRAHNGDFFEYFPKPAVVAAPPAIDPANDPSTPPTTDGGTYDGSSTL